MSKESRRAARLARESRQAGLGRPSAGSDARTDGGDPPIGATPVATHLGAPVATPGGTAGGPSAAPGSPAARARAGRRTTARVAPRRTFLERYRSAIVTIAAVAVVAVAVGFVFIGSTSPAYACTNVFSPSPTPPLAPGSSDRLGFFQEDMANSHVVSPPQKYLYCPPASGNHYNGSGIGPIQPRVYKPEDKVGPANWIHNLEHGGLVVLYRNDSPGSTAAGLQAFRDFSAALPPTAICKVATGVISPVVARFDDMPHPYAALVWDRVFYLDTWDPALVNQFYLTESERLDADGALVAPPEKAYCQGSPPPSVDPNASASPAGPGSPAASVPASVAPSVAVPSSSPEPSAAPS
ncbi:MAG TPA: DUF3105 domain-containing protein [Patescibacteria group bacterium]|nr:DUF3105 domain-containing protein [Patescibacteria group bacterium]